MTKCVRSTTSYLSSSDVSASLMTALLVPDLQVLTVMNILPQRRRSACVTKKLPLNHGQVDIAATTRHIVPSHAPSGMCHGVYCPIFRSARGSATTKTKPHGGGLRQTSPSHPSYLRKLPTKGKNFDASSSNLPRVLSSRRTKRKTARPPRCYPRTCAHH